MRDYPKLATRLPYCVVQASTMHSVSATLVRLECRVLSCVCHYMTGLGALPHDMRATGKHRAGGGRRGTVGKPSTGPALALVRDTGNQPVICRATQEGQTPNIYRRTIGDSPLRALLAKAATRPAKDLEAFLNAAADFAQERGPEQLVHAFSDPDPVVACAAAMSTTRLRNDPTFLEPLLEAGAAKALVAQLAHPTPFAAGEPCGPSPNCWRTPRGGSPCWRPAWSRSWWLQ